MKIVIADRSALICERLEAMFNNIDDVQVVDVISDVKMIFDSIRKNVPDVLILDSELLGINGIDLIKNLKRVSFIPLLIMLTNYSLPQYRRRYLDAGADFHFDKAYEFNKIPDAMNCLKMRQAG